MATATKAKGLKGVTDRRTVLEYKGERHDLKPTRRQRILEGPKPSRSSQVAARPQTKGNTTTYSGRLGAILRKRREELGLSVEAFKDFLATNDVEVTVHTVYHWEKGLRPIPLNAVPAIAKILKLAIRDLLPAK